jgi:phosphoribosylformylglycinamidine synthase subunit PurS
MYIVKVHVMLKDDVLDPQGKTVNHALDHLGFKDVSNMKIGKYIEFLIESKDQKYVNLQVDKISKQVLSNPVIEKYEFTIERI